MLVQVVEMTIHSLLLLVGQVDPAGLQVEVYEQSFGLFSLLLLLLLLLLLAYSSL